MALTKKIIGQKNGRQKNGGRSALLRNRALPGLAGDSLLMNREVVDAMMR
jgi:hypothetical protein